MDVRVEYDIIYQLRLFQTITEEEYPEAVIRWTIHFQTNKQVWISFGSRTEPITALTKVIPQDVRNYKLPNVTKYKGHVNL